MQPFYGTQQIPGCCAVSLISGGKTASGEDAAYGNPGYTCSVTDFIEGHAGVTQGYGRLQCDAPFSGTAVAPAVLGVRKHLEVARVVVQTVFVFVVHDLGTRKRPSQYALHDNSVLEALSPVDVNESILSFTPKPANMPFSLRNESHVMFGFGQVKVGS